MSMGLVVSSWSCRERDTMVVTGGAVGAMELVTMDTWWVQKRRRRREGKRDEEEEDEGKDEDEEDEEKEGRRRP